MIVDDDPTVAGMIEDSLNSHGHEASSFGHGGLALGAIVRGKFELLICDLNLPNISGLQTIRLARGQFPYLPVIAISGKEPGDVDQECYEAGASCYLQKPIDLPRLNSEIQLVEDSQVQLAVGIVDKDDDHAHTLDRNLSTMGCTVIRWHTINDMMEDTLGQGISVLLVDSAQEEVEAAMKWGSERDMATVAFGKEGDADFNEDSLMRWGASFCLVKPIDEEALITQARFFVSPDRKKPQF